MPLDSIVSMMGRAMDDVKLCPTHQEMVLVMVAIAYDMWRSQNECK